MRRLRGVLVALAFVALVVALGDAPTGAQTTSPSTDADSPAPAAGPEGITVLPSFDCSPLPVCNRVIGLDVIASPATSSSFTFTATERDTGQTRRGTTDPGGGDGGFSVGMSRTYTIRLTGGPAGYEVTGVSCDGRTSHVVGDSVRLDPGIPFVDPVLSNCTFRVKRPGSIRISQVTVPSSPEDFSYATTGSGLSAFLLDNEELGPGRSTLPRSRTFRNLAPRDYTVTLARRTGFALTGLTCDTGEAPDLAQRRVTITLAQGEDVDCRFTITRLARARIVLDVRPEDPLDFAFDLSELGGSPNTVLDDDGTPGPAGLSNARQFALLLPGGYTVRQLTDGAGNGIDLRQITCDGAVLGSNTLTRRLSFHLDPGQNLSCTFRNERQGRITVVEDSRPDGPKDYVFTHNAAPFSFTLDDDTDAAFGRSLDLAGLASGSVHVITQDPASGTPPWKLTSVSCDTGETTSVAARTAVVTVDPGEHTTCTFVNAQFQPDALIGPTRNGPFQGDDIRSGQVLAAQTLEETVAGDGRRTAIVVQFQNDSGETDDLVVRSAESGQGRFGVVYFRGAEDVTAQVLSPGGLTFADVAEGGQRFLTVEFTSQANSVVGTGRNADITVTSTTAPAATDLVRARGERR